MSAALDRVLDRLCCPHCAAALAREGAVLACARGHRYDIARDGHVTLLPPGGRRHAGDTAAMVGARAAFLAAGHFAPLTAALVDAVRAASPPDGCVVDLGAGTGHHLAAVLDALPAADGIALDVSAPALRRAAREHPRMAAVGADVWQALPLRDAAAAVVTCVFAPRNGAEIARVLVPGGALVTVTPAEHHLAELRPLLGTLQVDAAKPARLRAALPQFAGVARSAVEFPLVLDRDALRAVVAMGPSARHIAPDELERRIARAPAPLRATAAVVVETFSARPAASRSG